MEMSHIGEGAGTGAAGYPLVKRGLDVAFSATGLVLLAPLHGLIALLVKFSSPGPVLYRQERIGRDCIPFQLLKFRTMRVGAESEGPLVTAKGDTRVTWVGRILRKTKLDELPQLWNVLRGEMSLVGPRPQTRGYYELYREDYARVLEQVRPGITDFAAIRYRDEEGELAQHADPERVYIEHLIPAKLRLYEEYIRRMSLRTDLGILFRTVFAIFSSPARRGNMVRMRRHPTLRLEPSEREVTSEVA